MDPTLLLGLGIPILTFGIICISAVFILAVTVGIFYAVFRLVKNMQQQQQKRVDELMRVGTEGEATVLALQDTGMLINHNPRVNLQLEINMPSRPPYTISKTATIPLIRLAQIQVGAKIPVMVDMSDPTNPDKVGLMLK